MHWLPALQRIHFKQYTLVYKIPHGVAPARIAEMCAKRSFDSERHCDLLFAAGLR